MTFLEAAGCYGSTPQVEPWNKAMIQFSYRSIIEAEHCAKNGDDMPLAADRHALVRAVALKDDPRLSRGHLARVDQMLDIAANAQNFARRASCRSGLQGAGTASDWSLSDKTRLKL